MAIITISRGSYSKGKEVAEKVAENLGYQLHLSGDSAGSLGAFQHISNKTGP